MNANNDSEKARSEAPVSIKKRFGDYDRSDGIPRRNEFMRSEIDENQIVKLLAFFIAFIPFALMNDFFLGIILLTINYFGIKTFLVFLTMKFINHDYILRLLAPRYD